LVKYTSNSDGYSYLPGTPAGIFAFQPDPVTGNSTLLTSSTITAGFTAGLPDVSFDAAAGQTTAQLTSTLQAALFSAGYKTILMAPAELEARTPWSNLSFSLLRYFEWQDTIKSWTSCDSVITSHVATAYHPDK